MLSFMPMSSPAHRTDTGRRPPHARWPLHRIRITLCAALASLVLALPGLATAQSASGGDESRGALGITDLTAAEVPGGAPIEFSARVDGQAASVSLSHRLSGEQRFRRKSMTADDQGVWRARIAAPADQLRAVEYFLEASSRQGEQALAGTGERPKRIAVVGSEESDSRAIVVVPTEREPAEEAEAPPRAPDSGIDFIAPAIAHDPDAIDTDDSRRFVATVTDNDQVGQVQLFYRTDAEDPFEAVVMTAGSSDAYSVRLPLADDFSGAIEYYIEASDVTGTTSTRASAFSPLQREVGLGAAEVPIETASAETSSASPPAGDAAAEPRRRKKWPYIVGGAIVLGLLVGLAASGAAEEEGEGDCCDVTFVVEPVPQ